jgi:phosphatidylglycerophosphate synthase
VTGISALFTFSGIAVLAIGEPSWLMGIVVTLLLAIGYALDSSDGQLARLRGGGSMFGEWLDHMIDSLKIASLHLAVAILAYRTFDVDERWLLVPLAFSAVGVVHFVGMLLTELLGRVQAARTGVATPGGEYSRLNSILKLPTDYGVLCLVFVLLGAPEAFRVVYTVLAASTIGYTLLVVGRWARRLQALDAATPPRAR